MNENVYQGKLIKRIENRFPGCLVMKNDSAHRQGIPDLTILHGKCWAALEVKADPSAPARPNQEHYIQRLDKLSFAAFINPDNEEDVLDALQRAFESCGGPRVSES
jgi:hypothetical protein